MARRGKKPEVTTEQRRDWLRRHEIGQSAPAIARSDGFDVRTVRKHLEMAKQEYEVREARSLVLRNALEGHYQDLCKYAEGLNSIIIEDDKPYAITLDPYMETALQQHLPRSPIWKDLSKRTQLKNKLEEQEDDVKRRLKEEVERDPRLRNVLAAGETQAIGNIIEVLAVQAKSWAQGMWSLNLKDNFEAQPIESGLVKVHYGFAQMGEVKKDHVEQILEVIKDFESNIKQWEQYEDMRRSYVEFERVKRDLQEELAVIIHRRVVPGKCKFCPI